jgi:hypothetical protein
MRLLPRPDAVRARVRSLSDVTLTPMQARAVALPPDRSLLVLGDAGFGKTTVALHRLAALFRAARARDHAAKFRACIVAPTEGLRLLLATESAHLGADVPAFTWDRWARRRAKRAFADLPREGEGARPATQRLKRDPALAAAIARIAAAPPRPIDDDEDAPPVRTKAHAQRSDLQHLFGDRVLLELVVSAARGRLPDHAIAETLDHTRVQFSLRTERAWSHVTDRKRLRAVDGASLDAGTPDGDAGAVDPEDYAVLFALDRVRALGVGSPTPVRAYDAIVLDEAQELAPIELELLARARRATGSFVVAGDGEQQIDPRGAFFGWDAAMEALGVEAERIELDAGFRCPPAVAALGAAIRAGTGLDALRAPFVAPVAGAAETAAWLDRELDAVLEADPAATIAILARDATAAHAVAAAMQRVVRVVTDGKFPRRGAVVTEVGQVKGLEFDHVIVFDAAAWDRDDAGRRALYVAVTRARWQLVLA